MKKLSLIILTYNSEKDIYDCLASVYKYNDIGEELEVIVVDNQSAAFEQMRDNILASYPLVRITQNTHNGGYGQGNNVGIRMASASIVAILNPDVRLMCPIFGSALRILEANDVMMCGGKQMYTPTQPGWSYAFDYTTMSYLQLLLRNIYKRLDYYDYRRMHLSGAFFFIKKKCFEQIGFFDEQLFMYGEECDIHLRLRKTFPKKKIVFLATSRYIHLTMEREFEEKRYRQLLEGDMYVCQKHNISLKRYLRTRIFALQLCKLRDYLIGKQNINQINTYTKMIKITKQIKQNIPG